LTLTDFTKIYSLFVRRYVMSDKEEKIESLSDEVLEKYSEPGAPPMPTKGTYSSLEELNATFETWVKERRKWEAEQNDLPSRP
jgi:23S rRNA maturation mini-RNase III